MVRWSRYNDLFPASCVGMMCLNGIGISSELSLQHNVTDSDNSNAMPLQALTSILTNKHPTPHSSPCTPPDTPLSPASSLPSPSESLSDRPLFPQAYYAHTPSPHSHVVERRSQIRDRRSQQLQHHVRLLHRAIHELEIPVVHASPLPYVGGITYLNSSVSF